VDLWLPLQRVNSILLAAGAKADPTAVILAIEFDSNGANPQLRMISGSPFAVKRPGKGPPKIIPSSNGSALGGSSTPTSSNGRCAPCGSAPVRPPAFSL
jgi:hypothetical protein